MTKLPRRWNSITNTSRDYKPNALSNDAITELKTRTNEIVAPRSSTLRQQDVDTILTALAEKLSVPIDTVIIILAVFFQQGATARSCDGNTVITVYGIEYKLATIRATLKECKFPRTEKKLARSLCEDIYTTCNVLNLPGNLASKIRRLNPEHVFNDGDDIWLSDFQLNNKNIPNKLKAFIQNTFENKANRGKKAK